MDAGLGLVLRFLNTVPYSSGMRHYLGGAGILPVYEGMTGKMPVPPRLPEMRNRICAMAHLGAGPCDRA
jgi:hypothetical protein